ncbi:MAG: hypothetical protein H7X97_11880 [Opitutaceae bacterium]|nr:hypothetical protein [Verrucomicrobiales bacterium]
MNLLTRILPILLLTVATAEWATAGAPRENLPSAEWVVSNLVRRVEFSSKLTGAKPYRYTRETVIEELDGKGEVKSRKAKTHEVTLISGIPFPRLTHQDGKPLSLEAARKAGDKDQKTRNEFVKKKTVQRVDRLQTFLNQDLFSRYALTTVRRELVNGRSAYVVNYRPKSQDQGDESMLDRVMNNISGTLWVDEADFEIARVTMVLGKRVTFWGGLAGVLDRLQMTLDRAPGTDGVWFNRSGWLVMEGRKLLEKIKLKAWEETKDFGPAPVPQQATPTPAQK